MTEAVLRAAGLRTGLYYVAAPGAVHRADPDRGRRGGRRSPGRARRGVVAATEVPLTYFEVATALAFLAMAEAGVEVAVLETGLGGRLDAVTDLRARAPRPSRHRPRSHRLPRRHAAGDRAREGRHHEAGRPVFRRPRLPLEADAELERAAGAVGAPLLRLGRDFDAPPFPMRARGRAPGSTTRRWRSSWRARPAAAGRPIDDRSAGAWAGGRALAGPLRAGGRRPAVRLRAQRRWRARAGGGGGRACARPAGRVARVDRRRQGSGGDAGGAGARRGGGRDDPV